MNMCDKTACIFLCTVITFIRQRGNRANRMRRQKNETRLGREFAFYTLAEKGKT